MSTVQLTGKLSPVLVTNASFDEDASNNGFAYFASSTSSASTGFLIIYETSEILFRHRMRDVKKL